MTKDISINRDAKKVTIVGMVCNIILTGIKFVIGIIGNSAAMVADATHSLSDMVTDVITIVSLHLSAKPCDEDHPYGHGKIETLATTIVGSGVIFAGVWIAYGGIQSLTENKIYIPDKLNLIAAGLSIVVKEFLYHYTVRVGRKINSPVVVANAWHHRSDSISSVAALIGICFAICGYPIGDPIAACAVAILIIQVGVNINLETIKVLIDTIPDKAIIEQINCLAMEVAGVRGAHALKARQSGPHILVDIDIEVSPTITVKKGHDIAVEVQNNILNKMKNVTNVMVHLDVTNDHED